MSSFKDKVKMMAGMKVINEETGGEGERYYGFFINVLRGAVAKGMTFEQALPAMKAQQRMSDDDFRKVSRVWNIVKQRYGFAEGTGFVPKDVSETNTSAAISAKGGFQIGSNEIEKVQGVAKVKLDALLQQYNDKVMKVSGAGLKNQNTSFAQPKQSAKVKREKMYDEKNSAKVKKMSGYVSKKKMSADTESMDEGFYA